MSAGARPPAAAQASRNHVSQADDLADLKETVKEEMPNWLALLRQYDDDDSPDPLARWGW